MIVRISPLPPPTSVATQHIVTIMDRITQSPQMRDILAPMPFLPIHAVSQILSLVEPSDFDARNGEEE